MRLILSKGLVLFLYKSVQKNNLCTVFKGIPLGTITFFVHKGIKNNL